MHRATPTPEEQEDVRAEAARRLAAQQANPEPTREWSHIPPRYFALPEGTHLIGDLIIVSIFNRPLEERPVVIEEISIRRYYNDLGREWFLAPEPTLEQEVTQAQNDEVMQCIRLDDCRRRNVREISRLRRMLHPVLTRLAHLGVTNMLDWAPERRAQYHVERRVLREEVNAIRGRLEELHRALPEGYLERFLDVPLEAEISIRVYL